MLASVFMKHFFALVLSCSSSSFAEDAKPVVAQNMEVVKLQRESVMLPQSAHRAGKQKNFYWAKLSVGNPPQEFKVSFDLGGGTMVLPSQSCTDHACLERNRYRKWDSSTAEDIQANGQLVEPKVPKTLLRRRDRGTIGLDSIDIGMGKAVGNFVREQVCVHGDDNESRCFPLALLAANSMTDLPFLTEPYDGTVGLGLQGMSLSNEFNFLASYQQGYYMNSLAVNSFGLHIGSENGGEIVFGGYDARRLTHPLKWTSVAAPEEGRWQVSVTAIRVGNTTLDACREKPCRAALDYSSSLLSAPTSLVGSLEATLAGLAVPQGFGDGCQYMSIPEISLELPDNVTLTLPAEDYVNAFGSQKTMLSRPSCEPRLGHHHTEDMVGADDVFIIGESTLRRYYTVFDVDALKVGFSLATSSQALLDQKSDQSKIEGKKDKTKSDSPVIFLVQVTVKKSKTLF